MNTIEAKIRKTLLTIFLTNVVIYFNKTLFDQTKTILELIVECFMFRSGTCREN